MELLFQFDVKVIKRPRFVFRLFFVYPLLYAYSKKHVHVSEKRCTCLQKKTYIFFERDHSPKKENKKNFYLIFFSSSDEQLLCLEFCPVGGMKREK